MCPSLRSQERAMPSNPVTRQMFGGWRCCKMVAAFNKSILAHVIAAYHEIFVTDAGCYILELYEHRLLQCLALSIILVCHVCMP